MNTIESRVSVPNVAMSVVTSMFLHGGIFHLGGNMLYLWIFGNNIEDVMGGKRFIIFYLVCGVIAVYSHAWFQTQSQIPMIGASGAVSGVLGAYLLLFPNARVLTLIPLGIIMPIVHVPAVVVLGVWFAVQIFSSLSVSLAAPLGAGGVAWFAHVGGFVAGMSLIFFFKNRRRVYRR
jgi:membrane associated rhomboid family serine protease